MYEHFFYIPSVNPFCTFRKKTSYLKPGCSLRLYELATDSNTFTYIFGWGICEWKIHNAWWKIRVLRVGDVSTKCHCYKLFSHTCKVILKKFVWMCCILFREFKVLEYSHTFMILLFLRLQLSNHQDLRALEIIICKKQQYAWWIIPVQNLLSVFTRPIEINYN